MIQNYFKIAWRNLRNQPFFTFLNIFGLTIGIAGSLLIALYIYDELNYDTMFADANRIYRVDADVKFGSAAHNGAKVPAPMAKSIVSDCPQVEMVTRISDEASVLIKSMDSQNNIKEKHVAFVDANIFKMFGIDLLEGDIDTALKEPNTVVLTKTAAKKHFGETNSIGQQLLLNNTNLYTVTGIIDDFAKNTFLRNHTIFISTSGYGKAQENDWGEFNFYTFVKLLPEANIEDFQATIKGFVDNYLIPWAQTFYPGMTKEGLKKSGNYVHFKTMLLTDVHLSGNKEEELSSNSSMQDLYILSCIGLFLMVLACVNFINLSTAYSLQRAKEVGIRKTLGSNKLSIIKQFFSESVLISFIALFFGIVVSFIALPFFNNLTGKTLTLPFSNPIFILILLLSTLALSVISGWYPALFMSRFIPVKVLKGLGKSSSKGGGIRNSLVVFQFSISLVLIVATIVVYQQLSFIQNKDLGFSKDQVLIIEDAFGAKKNIESLKKEIQKLAHVKSVTVSSYLPTPSERINYTFFKEGYSSQEYAINMQKWDVDYDYVSTLGMQLIAGRDFDKQFVTDNNAIILNESVVKVLGVTPQEAIGMKITSDLVKNNKAYATVIGVVKNFPYQSLKNDIGNLGLTLGKSKKSMAVLLEAGDFSKTIASMESIWKRLAPGEPFSYNFMENSFNSVYKEEQKLGLIFIVFTVLSLLIACLGLFGLAAFNAQKHLKEIGVRKVLGASVNQITFKLIFTFLKLVGIAILISLPISWYAMNIWLQDFAHRIDIGWQTFVLAIGFAVVVAVLTVSFQSIKAAIVNPIKSLRTE